MNARHATASSTRCGLRARSALLLAGLILAPLALPAPAEAQTATAKQCADRWNDMKAKNQTGDLTFRQFSQSCMAGTTSSSTAAPAQKPAASANAPSAAPTRASAKECAERWNDMKAKNQTGDLTYRQFSQSCMTGTSPSAPAATAAPSQKPAASGRTSVPSTGSRPVSDTARAAREEDSASDKAALERCNAEWKTYKARNNLTGAKAWHVFMARCL